MQSEFHKGWWNKFTGQKYMPLGQIFEKQKVNPLENRMKINKFEEDKYVVQHKEQDFFNSSPLQIALDINNVQDKELSNLLMGRRANARIKESILVIAIQRNPEYVSGILSSVSGKDMVNIPDVRGNFPLHHAVVHENTDVMKLLLDNGAFIECKNHNGKTPLHLAHPYVNCVQLLIDRGALVNTRDNNGDTPLHYAVARSSVVVDILLKHGAQVNSQNNNGQTPVFLAKSTCIKNLLNSGAQVNITDNLGRTPLHLAVMHYDGIDKVRLLLQMGSEVNNQDKEGCTPLHCWVKYLVLSDRILIANTLLDWGASLTIKNICGVKPSGVEIDHCAKQHNVRRACVKLSEPVKEEFQLEKNSYYRDSCLEEAERLKLVRFGKHSLCDIFCHYSDPIFLSNEALRDAVDSNDYRIQFPIYCTLLQSTYKKAKERSYLLESGVDTLITILPREITRYILTFVDDKSLQNVIKSKYTH